MHPIRWFPYTLQRTCPSQSSKCDVLPPCCLHQSPPLPSAPFCLPLPLPLTPPHHCEATAHPAPLCFASCHSCFPLRPHILQHKFPKPTRSPSFPQPKGEDVSSCLQTSCMQGSPSWAFLSLITHLLWHHFKAAFYKKVTCSPASLGVEPKKHTTAWGRGADAFFVSLVQHNSGFTESKSRIS